jgi:hypothetical protein
MANLKVYERQSMLDVAVQHSGGIESVFDFAFNNGLSITDDLNPYDTLLGCNDIVDLDIVYYYSNKGIIPSTALTDTDISQTIANEGIEFWTVGEDFIVS